MAMKFYSVEDFRNSIDSMYRLVIVASRRANQVSRAESRPFVTSHSRKPTVIALEEIHDGKVSYTTSAQDEEGYLE